MTLNSCDLLPQQTVATLASGHNELRWPWPLVTTNCGCMWPQITYLWLQECCDLRSQQNVEASGRKSMFWEMKWSPNVWRLCLHHHPTRATRSFRYHSGCRDSYCRMTLWLTMKPQVKMHLLTSFMEISPKFNFRVEIWFLCNKASYLVNFALYMNFLLWFIVFDLPHIKIMV